MPKYINNWDYSYGWDAAKGGVPKSECSIIDDAKREAWMDGWSDFHEGAINEERYIALKFREEELERREGEAKLTLGLK
jgi:hypothetical protein